MKLCRSSGAEEQDQSLPGAGAVAVTQFMTQAGKSQGKIRAFSPDLQEQLFWVTAKAEVTQVSISGVVNGTPGAVCRNNGVLCLVIFPIFSSLQLPVDDFVLNSSSWIRSLLLCPLAFETCNILWQNFRGQK